MTTVSPSATSSSVLLLLLSISVPLFVKFTSEFTVSTRIMMWPLFVTLGVTRSVTPVWMRSTATGALSCVCAPPLLMSGTKGTCTPEISSAVLLFSVVTLGSACTSRSETSWSASRKVEKSNPPSAVE